MVSIRFVSEELGAEAKWEAATKKVTVISASIAKEIVDYVRKKQNRTYQLLAKMFYESDYMILMSIKICIKN